MNNRWIYGLELVVFGWVAARGGWLALRSLTLLGRITGVLALLTAAATAMVLGAFVLDRPIAPLLHVTPLLGVALVFMYETARAGRAVPGWTAPFVGLYSTLGLLIARPRRPAQRATAASDSDTDEEPEL